MGRFFLFALLSWITGNPLLALLVIIALTVPSWLAGSRYAWRFHRWMRAQGEAGRLRRTLAVNPHDVKARTELGAILVRHGRFREARAELEQAMPRADDLPEANYAEREKKKIEKECGVIMSPVAVQNEEKGTDDVRDAERNNRL